MDHSLPGSSVLGILQARILEWVAMASSRGSSRLKPTSLRSPALAGGFFFTRDFPGSSDGKASAYNVGDQGSIPGSGRSLGEGNGYLTPVSLPGESYGPRSLAGYGPWGHKESDMTEHTSGYQTGL